MLHNMALRKKIAYGISGTFFLMIIVGMAGYFGLNRVLSMTELYKNINKLQRLVAAAKEQTDQYNLARYKEQVDLQKSSIRNALALMDEVNESISGLKIGLTDDVDDKSMEYHSSRQEGACQ